ncbi:MAG: 1-acyl-sn-glycerol-3-phosphate acyltransferase [Deltaproteobacteria bacterium]
MNSFDGKTHYPYVLDHKPGFFLTWFLYRLFKKVDLDENAKEGLKQMQKEGTVVYSIKYRGQLDYLLCHYNFRKRRLPYPKVAFDLNISMLLPFKQFVKLIFSQLAFLFKYGRQPNPYQTGFYETAIKKGITSLVFLVDPKRFVRKFVHAEKDPLQFLLETQREMERPVFLVPQLILYEKGPEKDYATLANILFGYKEQAGIIRKIVLFFRHHRQAFIGFGQPLNLKTFLENQDQTRPLSEMATEVRNILIESIDNQKRIVLGPIMKSRQQLKEIVLMDERVRERIEQMASAQKKGVHQLRKIAGEFFDEIAADYNITYVQLFHLNLSWLWKRIFEQIDVDPSGLAMVRDWARKGPLIFVPSHKSHIDYLILNYELFKYHMHIPRIAAGKNLAFWPMGHIFRKTGAFFIRRSYRFKHAKLYVEVFNRYIKALLQEGHPIEFFIEGGRSRNGKLVLPKTGFLSILLQAHREGYCRDLIFVPASIIYDRIIEEGSYRKEIEGGSKEKESLSKIIGARRFLNKRYGTIYLRFAEPFSLNEYLSETPLPESETVQGLAFHLVRAINEASLVTPLSLIATAILGNHRKGFLLSELTETVDILLDFLKSRNIPTVSSLTDASSAVQETLSLLINWKMADTLDGGDSDEETFYFVDEDKKVELEYYKNNVVHFFILHAFVASSLMSGQEEHKRMDSIKRDCTFLKDLFRNEFVFDEESFEQRVESAVAFFLNAGFLSQGEKDGSYKVTRLGFEKLTIWGALNKTYLESYWIACKTVAQRRDLEGKTEELLKQMDYLGKRFYKLGIVEHIGALSRLNFTNALEFIRKDILRPRPDSKEEEADISERLSQLAQRVYELSRFAP